ncbi:hypothetical protein ULMS_15750 [Patiriisocius marinistellae]|uniref:Methyltransferase domain-containing protein n=1 Tax=Patiriisocius marinistellae TaxID=2494560 RepID=A0A5J4FTZ5_9FLAO|nr:methyltransferase domain-containing protein [Patiriisocius marinistellae]GEQ86067.1 hypothetical protein ULMS_15750 [Patiriisocius marinistellae]
MKKEAGSPKKNKKPWPTKDAMEQVYAMNLWGGNSTKFYSGEGSHVTEVVKPYLDCVISFLSSFEKPLIVCDLGCGDFNIGKELVTFTNKYIAVDIVPALINYNRELFINKKLEFHCLDISKDDLPAADCVILRQVLQHLSNAEILSIVNKLTNYKYVILTEHIPNGEFIPNIDIISGQGTRLKKGSGVNLIEPPFSIKVKEEVNLVTTNLPDGKGMIATTIYSV